MKACVLIKPNELICRDIPKPKINSDEVLVKVMACGICGSDLRYLKGDNPWALHTLGKNIPSPPNMVLGHEFAGIVCEVGDKKNEYLLNKRVAVEPYNTCGQCVFCRTGRYNLCKDTIHIGHGAGWGKMEYYPGGMAQYCRSWATHVYELPDNLSFKNATLLDPMAVAIHAINISTFKPGMTALIIGAGPVGLCMGAALKAYGCEKLFTSEIIQNSLDFAMDFGTDIAINSLEKKLSDTVLNITKNRSIDVVFDTAGVDQTFNEGLACLSESGRFVSLTAHRDKISFSMSDLSGERSLIVSANNLYGDFIEAIRIISSSRFDFSKLITHSFIIEDVNKGFDALKNKDITHAQKIAILPWG